METKGIDDLTCLEDAISSNIKDYRDLVTSMLYLPMQYINKPTTLYVTITEMYSHDTPDLYFQYYFNKPLNINISIHFVFENYQAVCLFKSSEKKAHEMLNLKKLSPRFKCIKSISIKQPLGLHIRNSAFVNDIGIFERTGWDIISDFIKFSKFGWNLKINNNHTLWFKLTKDLLHEQMHQLYKHIIPAFNKPQMVQLLRKMKKTIEYERFHRKNDENDFLDALYKYLEFQEVLGFWSKFGVQV